MVVARKMGISDSLIHAWRKATNNDKREKRPRDWRNNFTFPMHKAHSRRIQLGLENLSFCGVDN